MTDDGTPVFLTMQGVIDEAGRLVWFPRFATSDATGVSDDPLGAITVEQLTARRRVVAVNRMSTGTPCGYPRPSDEMAFIGKIPLSPECRAMRLLLDGRTIEELTVPAEQPQVRFEWTFDGSEEGRSEVRWEAFHPDGVDLHYLLSFSHNGGRSWRPVSMVTAEPSASVAFGQVPGGRLCMLRVLATDGFHTVAADSAPFELPERPCQAFIVWPVDDMVLDEAHPVLLNGQGYWREEARPEAEQLRWTSSRDGVLGVGTLVTTTLTPGRHQITLTAGEGERAGTDTVAVDVNATA
jgi:hypothetical protein